MKNALIRYLLFPAGILLAVLAALWAAGALYFDMPAPYIVRLISTLGWLAGFTLALIFIRKVPLEMTSAGVTFVIILAWWLSLKPSQYRHWKPEVAVVPYAEVNGDSVVVHRIRNFEYRTREDFTPRYDTRTFSLSELRGIDIFQTYWGSERIAHPVISFDFGPQGHLAFSIETRPEVGEKYSAIGGLYRQYELIMIAADERDVVRLRTNYRKEDCYLYRLKISPEASRRRFLDYVKTMNRLKEEPQWYNAITDNCTTSIRAQTDANLRQAWDWRMLVNGYADEMLYERGGLDGSLPFPELKKRAHINERAMAAGDAADFSERIRTHLAPAAPAQP